MKLFHKWKKLGTLTSLIETSCCCCFCSTSIQWIANLGKLLKYAKVLGWIEMSRIRSFFQPSLNLLLKWNFFTFQTQLETHQFTSCYLSSFYWLESFSTLSLCLNLARGYSSSSQASVLFSEVIIIKQENPTNISL